MNMNTAQETENEKDKIPVTTEAYNIVKDQIVTLKILPGQLLMVQQLSKEYGISRTPVREALVRLKEEGLVTAADGRKFQVSYITWKLIKDIYRARQTVEISTVANAAQNYCDELGEKLTVVSGRMKKSYEQGQYSDYFEADNGFHELLLKYLDNEVISNWMGKISDQQQRIRYATMGISTSMEISFNEHMSMIKAIREGDVETAKKGMEEHLERALRDILKLRDQANPYLTAFIQD